MLNKTNAALGLAAIALAVTSAGAAQSTAAHNDGTFMRSAASAGMAEVEVGQLALTKATKPEVKEFAQMIVDDHTKANDELRKLAEDKKVTLPKGPTPAQEAEKDRLSKLSGASFDSAFVKAMVTDHTKAVSLFTHESKMDADADAKAWAAKMLPALESHKSKAVDLSGHKTASTTPHQKTSSASRY